jgi:hypothetical protein
MNPNKKAVFAFVLSAVLMAGCGSGNSPITVDQDSLAKATTMHSLYTKANGDYSALSPADKASFEKIVGSGEKAEKAWQQLAPQKANRG